MRAKVLEILSGMKSFLAEGLSNRRKYLIEPAAFTRKRILTFERLCVFLLSNCKRSLGLELDEFFLGQDQWPCTKSAFSQARYRVRSVFFRDWSNCLVDLVYDRALRGLRTWKHLYLKGVDGTTLYLFDQEGVMAEFGGSGNQHGSVAMARAGFQVDLLNGYCCGAWLGPHKLGEPHFASSFLSEAADRDLLIYDRNFISFELIYKHLQLGVFFLMRSATTFNKTVQHFLRSGQKQATEYFPITDDAYKSLKKQGFEVERGTMVRVRLVRVELESGETEVLVTNLYDEKKYPFRCFKALYGKRWGCETQIEKFKNKLQLEIFTGHKPEAIYQDFFAAVIVLNLHNLIVRSCDKKVMKINKPREKPGAVNQNISMGLLKKRLVQLFENKDAATILKVLKLLFISHLELIRPGRKYSRQPTKKRQKGKYQTYTNYRRAF